MSRCSRPDEVPRALDDELTVDREVDDDPLPPARHRGGWSAWSWSASRSRTATRRSRSLGALLLIGGPILLLLTAAIGYGATALALRPVERMRARAAEIEATDRGARLPVPDDGRRDRPARRRP